MACEPEVICGIVNPLPHTVGAGVTPPMAKAVAGETTGIETLAGHSNTTATLPTITNGHLNGSVIKTNGKGADQSTKDQRGIRYILNDAGKLSGESRKAHKPSHPRSISGKRFG